jgi:hypothetical protein
VTDRDFENYLALLSGMLRLRRSQRASIAGELRDHLIEHVAHLESTGISHEEAVRKALEEFGDAAALAANFSALVGMRRRRLIMRCTIGTTVVMTGLVVALLAFRPEVVDDPSVVQAQADPAAVRAKANPDARPAAKKADLSRNEQANAETRRKLETLIDVEFNETPLNDVLKFIGTKVSTQFYLDPKSLADAVIATDTPITLQLRQVPAEMALDLILQALQAGYTVRSGVIIVRTQTDLKQDMETNVYHVSHEAAQRLAEIIPITVATDTWNTVGGAGSMAVFYDSLIISHTPEVHQRIGKLLKDLEPVLANLPKSPMPWSVGMMPSRYPGGEAAGGYGASSGRTGYGPSAGPGYGLPSPGRYPSRTSREWDETQTRRVKSLPPGGGNETDRGGGGDSTLPSAGPAPSATSPIPGTASAPDPFGETPATPPASNTPGGAPGSSPATDPETPTKPTAES